ncbi:flagellar protein FlgN [Alkalihalobacterium chitinilyticum]|uniref:Flagellar protein FlgN n=1 Tax=Alkalihalobacterium chitinilyticum TaxID=2980103 RepID=A0ABT5VF04_9BACI|nr:flagellar protein FlgN [Alkalihalobacterium chitinilyticum]MDE5414041.1 flagellar protein FlgN [Alkalihalobacterium chitinilyticum]
MSAKAVIAVLADLTKLHKTFNEIAREKTDVIQKNDMPALDVLIKKEGALIHQLRKLEQDRMIVVEEYLKSKGLVTEGVTMDQLLELAPKEEQPILTKIHRALMSEIDKLKQNNELNQQLIEDSLRFVNLSLDLMAPEPDDVTYQRPMQKNYEAGSSRSIFDSKA